MKRENPSSVLGRTVLPTVAVLLVGLCIVACNELEVDSGTDPIGFIPQGNSCGRSATCDAYDGCSTGQFCGASTLPPSCLGIGGVANAVSWTIHAPSDGSGQACCQVSGSVTEAVCVYSTSDSECEGPVTRRQGSITLEFPTPETSYTVVGSSGNAIECPLAGIFCSPGACP
jgi:hypothetical protein